uniref:Protein fam179b n=1 Tax=Tetraselmis sp. GSL018 TaxID=582737 RepID=A0A061SG72_9CHLO
MSRLSDSDEEGAVAPRAPSGNPSDRAKGGSVEELETHQLQPLPNPAQALPKILKALNAANSAKRQQLDWVAQYEAITDARRLIVHHKDILSGNLHALVMAALPAAQELRSLTAKNAMMLWQEAFRFLGRLLDPELEQICPVLLKKAGSRAARRSSRAPPRALCWR